MMVPYEEPRERRRPRQQNRTPRPNSPGPASAALVVYNPQQRQVAPARQPHQEYASKGPLHLRDVDIRQSYKVLPVVIGQGAFGTVRCCIHRDSRKKLAVKSIRKVDNAKNVQLLQNEISLLQQLNHRHVIRVIECIQDPEYIHIIMEQCTGGDLFDLATGTVRQPEGGIRRLISGLVDAVNYLHSRHVVHRDIKAEHIMFAREGDPNSPIKIIDFGVATLHKPGDPPLNAFAGSMRTVAPEVIKRSYDNQCDMWSVGVVTFFLLTQQMPFNGGTNQEIFQKICSGQFFFPRWTEQGLSEEAKDFIDDLLVLDPRERMTSREASAHPWIRGQMTKSRSWKQHMPQQMKQISRPRMPQQMSRPQMENMRRPRGPRMSRNRGERERMTSSHETGGKKKKPMLLLGY